MLKRLFVTLLLLLSLPALAGRLAVLTDPPPLEVPAGLTQEEVAKAIIAGMDKRHWVAESAKPGEIVAVQSPRDLVAKVKITYDTKTVTIAYLDSTNFLYQEEDGKREIHQKYNAWVLNLSRDIQSVLTAAAVLNQQH